MKKKGGKGRKITFSPIFGNGRELERERRKTPPSLYDLRRSGGRNSSSQDLKFIYSTRATRGYRQHAISLKISCLEKKFRERNSDFFLRSTELGWSSRVGPSVKPEKNLNFLKKGKMVISVKIRNFSRSRMMKRTSPLELSRKI